MNEWRLLRLRTCASENRRAHQWGIQRRPLVGCALEEKSVWCPCGCVRKKQEEGKDLLRLRRFSDD